MKPIDFSCASPASTAICSSIDKRAMVRHGTRPIDRRHHHIGDRRKPKNNIPLVPCSFQPPINPKPYYQKSRKSASSSTSTRQNDHVIRRKSSGDINDLATTPYGSSRYLLSDKPYVDILSETDHLSALVPSQPVMPRSLSSNDSIISNPINTTMISSQPYKSRRQLSSNDSLVLKSVNKQLVSSQPEDKLSRKSSTHDSSVLKSSSARSLSRYQVVELKVSIHCKGCEGKVRKHISRMEGVTSFTIDRATKKVIVIGDVTPLGVLSSISRVKNAQFWSSPTSSSSS